MATYTPGQTLTAAIMQALDDRVTVLESTTSSTTAGLPVHGQATGTTSAAGRLTFAHSLGSTPTCWSFSMNSGGAAATTYVGAMLTNGNPNITIQVCTITGVVTNAVSVTVNYILYP